MKMHVAMALVTICLIIGFAIGPISRQRYAPLEVAVGEVTCLAICCGPCLPVKREIDGKYGKNSDRMLTIGHGMSFALATRFWQSRHSVLLSFDRVGPAGANNSITTGCEA